MKAEAKVVAPTEQRKFDFTVRELHGELHNSLTEGYAALSSAGQIAGLAQLTELGMERLRALIMLAERSLADARTKSVALKNILATHGKVQK